MLFGAHHPYGKEVAGNEASIQAISRENLLKYYQRFWKPNHAALIFAGDIRLEEAVRLSEDSLGKWSPVEVPKIEVPIVGPPKNLRIYLVDRQDAPQSQVRLGSVGPKRNDD